MRGVPNWSLTSHSTSATPVLLVTRTLSMNTVLSPPTVLRPTNFNVCVPAVVVNAAVANSV